jgi:hypothetical protein
MLCNSEGSRARIIQKIISAKICGGMKQQKQISHICFIKLKKSAAPDPATPAACTLLKTTDILLNYYYIHVRCDGVAELSSSVQKIKKPFLTAASYTCKSNMQNTHQLVPNIISHQQVQERTNRWRCWCYCRGYAERREKKLFAANKTQATAFATQSALLLHLLTHRIPKYYVLMY